MAAEWVDLEGTTSEVVWLEVPAGLEEGGRRTVVTILKHCGDFDCNLTRVRLRNTSNHMLPYKMLLWRRLLQSHGYSARVRVCARIEKDNLELFKAVTSRT